MRRGSRSVNEPQKTPTMEQPLSKGRLRGMRGEADDEEAALPGDTAQGGFGVVAAERIDDDVDAVAIGEGFDALAEIFCTVVDEVISAVLFANCKFFVA